MSRYKTLFPAAVLILLLFPGSILITNFFKRELANDVDRERQKLESVVFRTYIREYQRINIFIQSIQQIQYDSEDEIKSSLESLLESYGDNGRIPYMIRSASYSLNNDFFTVRENSQDGLIWKQSSEIPDHARLDSSMETGEVQIRRHPDNNISYLYYKLSDQSNTLFIFELNKKGMDEYYVNPALKEALEEYNLEWKILAKDDYRTIVQNRRNRKYPFNPFLILIGLDHGEDASLMIPLPGSLESRGPFLPENIDDEPQKEGHDTFLKELRTFFPPDTDLDPFHNDGTILIISAHGAPYYNNLEKRIAINWLMSQVILTGVAFVILILILQLSRSKEIRNREKEFVASMTHELRTPITVIQSAADNLSKGIVSQDRVIGYGQMMKDQTGRLSTMIEEILLFSSLEGKSRVDSSPVVMDIIALLEEIEENFSALADEKQTTLNWDYKGLPPRLYGHPSEIKFIISNLVSNALNHAAGEEGIHVRVRFLIPGRLRITVEDSGPGISGTEQKKIFDPFYRSLLSREQQTRGSGLGLYIASKKTKLINGKLSLESPYKKINGEKCSGCRFTLETAGRVISQEDEGES